MPGPFDSPHAWSAFGQPDDVSLRVGRESQLDPGRRTVLRHDDRAPEGGGPLERGVDIIDGHQRTLEEVGKRFGVTRERIRQIEAKALRKLRHPSRSKKLRDYLE